VGQKPRAGKRLVQGVGVRPAVLECAESLSHGLPFRAEPALCEIIAGPEYVSDLHRLKETVFLRGGCQPGHAGGVAGGTDLDRQAPRLFPGRSDGAWKKSKGNGQAQDTHDATLSSK
jgi:hypothetical protein